jgi:hypothetical protein
MYTASMLRGGLKLNRLSGAAALSLSLLASISLWAFANTVHPFGLTFLAVFNLAGYIIGIWLVGDAIIRLKQLDQLHITHASR